MRFDGYNSNPTQPRPEDPTREPRKPKPDKNPPIPVRQPLPEPDTDKPNSTPKPEPIIPPAQSGRFTRFALR